MDITSLQKQLFQLIKESPLPIRDVAVDDKQNIIKLTSGSEKRFLILLTESKQPQITPRDSNPSRDDRANAYVAMHSKEDFLTYLDEFHKNNPYLFQIFSSCMKLHEMELLTNDEYERILYQLNLHQERLKQDYTRRKKVTDDTL